MYRAWYLWLFSALPVLDNLDSSIDLVQTQIKDSDLVCEIPRLNSESLVLDHIAGHFELLLKFVYSLIYFIG